MKLQCLQEIRDFCIQNIFELVIQVHQGNLLHGKINQEYRIKIFNTRFCLKRKIRIFARYL